MDNMEKVSKFSMEEIVEEFVYCYEFNSEAVAEKGNVEGLAIWYKSYIADLVNKVLHDSEEDPSYSAVTLCNRIKAYLRYIELSTGKASVVSQFLKEIGHSQEEVELIETKRAIESEYYRGEQL